MLYHALYKKYLSHIKSSNVLLVYFIITKFAFFNYDNMNNKQTKINK